VATDDTGAYGYLEFNYDQSTQFEDRGTLRIKPRGVEYLDYTPGGTDRDFDSASSDIGAPDEIHGESGDDFIHGMTDDDVLFGEGQDDDLTGGWGDDWVSGGTGTDGVLGDDGRIYTSRNVELGRRQNPAPYDTEDPMSEPLYAIFKVDEVDKRIDTPGNIQVAYISPEGELTKTVNLTPFNLSPIEDNFENPHDVPLRADDIIYGGLGDDFLHGGAGDDAMSGAEALGLFYAVPFNPGNVLAFDATREEFAAYDQYNPLKKIRVDADGVFTGEDLGPNSFEFLLNFDAQDPEAPLAIPGATDGIKTDGKDVLFGDLGHDWLVGGTGNDTLYGGWGSDLLNVDDDHNSPTQEPEDHPLANNTPDTHVSYEDRAFGGAGRDVLIANTGGDRTIDWAGEFNSYIVPFAPYGAFTISRGLPPHLFDFLYELSASQGADPTRVDDTGNDPERNGEPDGELGLVTQRDHRYWRDQTGAPNDPQPGNIPGGPRDVLRGADFNGGNADNFTPDSGKWSVVQGRFRVTPDQLGGDAVSVFYVDHVKPSYFEMLATVRAVKAQAGWEANAYLVFDYQNEFDFKFAGLNPKLNKLQIGHRTAEGWIVDVQNNMKLWEDTDYYMQLAVHGTTVTLVVDTRYVLTHTFDPRVDEYGQTFGLNAGMVGLGSENGRGEIDNVIVQVLPPEITFAETETFDDGAAQRYGNESTGDWQLVGDRYEAVPAVGEQTAFNLIDLGLDTSGIYPASVLRLNVTLNTENTGGVIFDQYTAEDYKFIALQPESDRIVIGHHTARSGWRIDAVLNRTLEAGADHELAISIVGLSVSVSINGQLGFGHVFNALVVDGGFGLLTRDGASSFGEVTIETNDPRFDALEQAASDKDFDSAASESGGAGTGTVALSMSMGTSTQSDEKATDTISETTATLSLNTYTADDAAGSRISSVEHQGAADAREDRLALSGKTLTRSSPYWLTRRSITASEPTEAGERWTAVEPSDDDRLESTLTTPSGSELLPRTTLSVDDWVQIVRSRRPSPRPHLDPLRP
jgi:Ca2+-binding RTX toxin-like protein